MEKRTHLYFIRGESVGPLYPKDAMPSRTANSGRPVLLLSRHYKSPSLFHIPGRKERSLDLSSISVRVQIGSSLISSSSKMSVKAGNDFLIALEARGDLALGPEDWTEVTHGTVRQILISHGDAINSIQVAYTDSYGTLILAHRHGGGGDRYDCINLGVGESLTMVKGSYGPVGRSSSSTASVVRSLTFGSSQATYGPFGMEEGAPFCFNVPSGVSFGGFHGRSDRNYLRAIGIYVRSIAKFHYSPKPDQLKPSLMTWSTSEYY